MACSLLWGWHRRAPRSSLSRATSLFYLPCPAQLAEESSPARAQAARPRTWESLPSPTRGMGVAASAPSQKGDVNPGRCVRGGSDKTLLVSCPSGDGSLWPERWMAWAPACGASCSRSSSDPSRALCRCAPPSPACVCAPRSQRLSPFLRVAERYRGIAFVSATRRWLRCFWDTTLPEPRLEVHRSSLQAAYEMKCNLT